MKEITRNLENLIQITYRKPDCPCIDDLLQAILNEPSQTGYEKVLIHIKNCAFCRTEIRILAEVSDIALPAELFGYDAQTLSTLAKSAEKIVRKLMPHELPHFAGYWKVALNGNWSTESGLPMATAAFSSSSQNRTISICRALLLLGTNPEASYLDAVAKSLHLSTSEHNALSAELL